MAKRKKMPTQFESAGRALVVPASGSSRRAAHDDFAAVNLHAVELEEADDRSAALSEKRDLRRVPIRDVKWRAAPLAHDLAVQLMQHLGRPMRKQATPAHAFLSDNASGTRQWRTRESTPARWLNGR